MTKFLVTETIHGYSIHVDGVLVKSIGDADDGGNSKTCLLEGILQGIAAGAGLGSIDNDSAVPWIKDENNNWILEA